MDLCRQSNSLLFNRLSRLVITFRSRSKNLLISWLLLSSAVILQPPKIVSQCFHCFPIYLSWSDGTRCHDLSFFECWVLSFFTLLFYFQEALQFLFAFCHKGGVICISEVIDIFPSNLDSNLCILQPRVSHEEALYSQQKQDWELTVAQIMNSLLPNSNLNWRKWGKPKDHSGIT